MDYLFESFTVYLLGGVLTGVAGFTFLWRRWDFPGYLKKRFRLDSRAKAMAYLIVFGMLLALCLAMVMAALGLSPSLAEFLEGMAIGFNCSLIPGLLRERPAGGRRSGPARNTNKRSMDKPTRRSKG